MKELLHNTSTQSRHFLHNMRTYNSSVSFAFYGCNDAPCTTRPWSILHPHPWTRYTTIRSHCIPNQGKTPQHGQLYILEARDLEATKAGHSHPHYNPKCNAKTMNTLQTILTEINPYAAVHTNTYMYQIEQEGIKTQQETMFRFQMSQCISKEILTRKGIMRPTHDEIAAVFVGPCWRWRNATIWVRHCYCTTHITSVIKYRSLNVFHHIPKRWPRFDSWRTPWRINRTQKRQTITLLQFYSHRLAIRQQFIPIHRAGKLYQQYIGAAYVKTESNRLNFLRQNQTQLCAERYQDLMDQLQSRAAATNLPLGKVVILPATF